MTRLCDFRLPWPPSVNRIWRNTPAGTLLSKEGRAYYARALSALPHERANPHEGRLAVWLALYAPSGTRRYDIDNRVKAVFDACTRGRVWLDDAQVDEIHVFRMPPDKAAPGVRIVIYEALDPSSVFN